MGSWDDKGERTWEKGNLRETVKKNDLLEETCLGGTRFAKKECNKKKGVQGNLGRK
jgi:hypothetical protein